MSTLCKDTVSDHTGWRSYPCGRKAKYGDYCGIHSPEQKMKRAKARGPTQFERDWAARKAEMERVKGLERAIRDALFIIEARITEIEEYGLDAATFMLRVRDRLRAADQ
jgi:hypothetical protein